MKNLSLTVIPLEGGKGSNYVIVKKDPPNLIPYYWTGKDFDNKGNINIVTWPHTEQGRADAEKQLDLLKTFLNPYLESFNKEFNFNLELRRAENMDEEIPNNPPVSLGLNYNPTIGFKGHFEELFSIIPFEETEKKPPFLLGGNWKPNKAIKFQLIKYKYHPGNRTYPPETEDIFVENYNNFNQALRKACEIILDEQLNDLWISVAENETDDYLIY